MEAADADSAQRVAHDAQGRSRLDQLDDAEQARRLNMEAAKAVRYGDVNDDQAFAMVTINPAKQLKIENRVGSIEVGKDADLVVWNHHPLSTAAIVERSYIDGIAYYDREKDLQRIAEIQKEKGARSSTDGSTGTTGTQAVTNGTQGATNGTQPAPRTAPPAERFDVKGNTDGATWALTNARIQTVLGCSKVPFYGGPSCRGHDAMPSGGKPWTFES
jgi:hypothetical protein